MQKLHIIEKETHPRDARVSFVKLSEAREACCCKRRYFRAFFSNYYGCEAWGFGSLIIMACNVFDFYEF